MNKGKGGWGIRTLSNLNKTLLSKWCWRFATKKGILLEESDYMGKHSEEQGGWCSKGNVWSGSVEGNQKSVRDFQQQDQVQDEQWEEGEILDG